MFCSQQTEDSSYCLNLNSNSPDLFSQNSKDFQDSEENHVYFDYEASLEETQSSPISAKEASEFAVAQFNYSPTAAMTQRTDHNLDWSSNLNLQYPPDKTDLQKFTDFDRRENRNLDEPPQISPMSVVYANGSRMESEISMRQSSAAFQPYPPNQLTPLPTGRHRKSQLNFPLQKPKFWTPNVDVNTEKFRQSDEAGDGKTFGIKRLFASFRRSKSLAPSGPIASNTGLITGSQDLRTTSMAPSKSRSVGGEEVTTRVLLLDGEEISLRLNKRALGRELMVRVCDGQDIVECDYFGLTYLDKKIGTWFWLDLDKKISKQIAVPSDWQFFFQVKFYPPEPSMLQDETTRYQLVLQVRLDVYSGKLPCSWVTQALLGSFLAQSEIGDYDPTVHRGTEYLQQFEFARNPTEQLLQKISELHANNKGMKPAQADIKYLETAKRLELYGLDLHPAKDMEDVLIHIGVGFSGVVIYRDRIRIGRFAWPKVLRISYKKNNFFLKIRPDYTEPVEATVGFRLQNPRLAKRLWKAAVEHHAFFRLKEPRGSGSAGGGVGGLKGRFPLGSQHQYSGRTFFQYRTLNIDRAELNRTVDRQRIASAPNGLNRAKLQYQSMHSLHRTHPRDMTLGKALSSDYLGPVRSQFNNQVSLPRTANRRKESETDTVGRLPSSGLNSNEANITSNYNRRRQPDPEGSLFDGSSRGGGGGSIIGVKSEDYEEPRRIYAGTYMDKSPAGDVTDDIADGYLNSPSMYGSEFSSYPANQRNFDASHFLGDRTYQDVIDEPRSQFNPSDHSYLSEVQKERQQLTRRRPSRTRAKENTPDSLSTEDDFHGHVEQPFYANLNPKTQYNQPRSRKPQHFPQRHPKPIQDEEFL